MTTSSTVELASGITVSFVSQGDRQGPAVLMLPGPTDGWRSYQPVLRLLPPTILAIAVSQRGHGDSDKPAEGYQVADFSRDAIDLLDALSLERAILVGHSGSCFTARRVAIDHPARVAGLVLEASPTSLRGDPKLQAFVDGVVAKLSDPIDPDFARGVVEDTASSMLPSEIVEELVADLLQVPARVWREMFAALSDYDDLDELGSISAPTLLVWGDADQLVPRETQVVLEGGLAVATRIEYPGVGHTPRWEVPDRFAADVVEFVERGALTS